MNKLAIPFILAGLIFLGLQSQYFFSKDEHEALPAGDLVETDLLVLVNKDNTLSDAYQVTLTEFEHVKLACVLVDDLEDMQNAAVKDNINLHIDNAYRTAEEQGHMFNNIIHDYIKQGVPQDVAAEKANDMAALPGYSEHETGLALDFSFDGNDRKKLDMWDWLSEHAYKYGFILRYPEGKMRITGYRGEPWHYRYVGREHARAIFEQGLTLEEYKIGFTHLDDARVAEERKSGAYSAYDESLNDGTEDIRTNIPNVRPPRPVGRSHRRAADQRMRRTHPQPDPGRKRQRVP